jgi:hypothetical protein
MSQPLHGIAGAMYQIVRPIRDRHYLQFLRRFPCVGCGTERKQRDTMHTGGRGLGQRASDRDALPGCRQCHMKLHRIGPARFQMRHKIEFAGLIRMFQEYYSLEFPARKPVGSEGGEEIVRRAV